MGRISQAQTPVGLIQGGAPLSRGNTNPDNDDDDDDMVKSTGPPRLAPATCRPVHFL